MPQHQPSSAASYNSSQQQQQQHLKQHQRKAVSKHHQPGGGSADNPGTPSSVTKQSAKSPIQAVNTTGAGGGSGGGATAVAGNNKQNKTGQWKHSSITTTSHLSCPTTSKCTAKPLVLLTHNSLTYNKCQTQTAKILAGPLTQYLTTHVCSKSVFPCYDSSLSYPGISTVQFVFYSKGNSTRNTHVCCGARS